MTEDRAISLNAVLEKAVYTETEEGWCGYTVDVDYIKSLPPVTPSAEEMAMQYQRGYIDGFKEGKNTFGPKTGHWIDIDEEPHEDYECDKCGYNISTYTANIEPHTEYKFCPNCGARMVAPRNLKYADNDTMMPAT